MSAICCPIFCNTMRRDRYNMLENNEITLLGKWTPTEYGSKDVKYGFVKTICNYCERYLVP